MMHVGVEAAIVGFWFRSGNYFSFSTLLHNKTIPKAMNNDIIISDDLRSALDPALEGHLLHAWSLRVPVPTYCVS